MTSLQHLPITITTTTMVYSSHSRSFFAMPSYFLTHGKRNHLSLRVSCTDNADASKKIETSRGKVDRRNMLLGLGGLYGAANLISTPGGASAELLKAPDFDKCHLANYKSNAGEKQFVECCLNASTEIIDYELPTVNEMKTRPAAHRVTNEYIAKYNMAIDRMKQLPKEDPRSFMQQANIHCAYCNGAYQNPDNKNKDIMIHDSWLFFPFHRWYIYFYERILGKLIDDPTFALPFWNWDHPEGMSMPDMFADRRSTLYNSRRDPKSMYAYKKLGDHGPSPLIDLSYGKPENLVDSNLKVMYNDMICANSDVYDFMGRPYGTAQPQSKSYSVTGSVERGCHSAVHFWVGEKKPDGAGEDMGNFYSAGRDPIFYSLHANVDRLWKLWQDDLPGTKFEERTITDPNFLDTEFLFYDENSKLVRVKVRDCLDNEKMGYRFEQTDIPWVYNQMVPSQTIDDKNKRAEMSAQIPMAVFPLPLDKDKVTIKVPKTRKGKGKTTDKLSFSGVKADPTKFVKFDVFVNEVDEKHKGDVCRASYAGTFSQIPRTGGHESKGTSFNLKLAQVYEKMLLGDDDYLLVTLFRKDDNPGSVEINSIEVVTENES